MATQYGNNIYSCLHFASHWPLMDAERKILLLFPPSLSLFLLHRNFAIFFQGQQFGFLKQPQCKTMVKAVYICSMTAIVLFPLPSPMFLSFCASRWEIYCPSFVDMSLSLKKQTLNCVPTLPFHQRTDNKLK